MNTWFPQKKALWMAENCTGTLHNLYTLRGAEVRDGNKWSHYLMESLSRYGDKAHDLNFDVNLHLTDTGEKYLLKVRSGILLYQKGEEVKHPDAVWRMPKDGLFTLLSKDKEKQAKLIRQEGDKSLLNRFSNAITVTKAFFNIIEP